MLAKVNRLSSANRIAELKETGQTKVSPAFTLKYLPKTKSEQSQFAFIVSKKIAKKAVTRNSIRRRLAQAVGESLPKVALGWDILFLTTRKAIDKEQKELTEEVKKALWKLA